MNLVNSKIKKKTISHLPLYGNEPIVWAFERMLLRPFGDY